jgi:hypothetical protein
MMLLGSQNLNEGEELIAQITSVEIQEIKSTSGKAEHVPVCQFENAPPMVLNITNSRTIASLYGECYDHWIGQSVQIYATKVKQFGGGEGLGLRIREAKPDTNQNIDHFESDLRACTTIPDLQAVFMAIPMHIKPRLVSVKDEMKESINAQA